MPVVPVVITGTAQAWKPGSKVVYGGDVRLVVHDPIPVEGYTNQDLDALRNQVRAIVEETYAAVRQ